jgi:hypothetical protein
MDWLASNYIVDLSKSSNDDKSFIDIRKVKFSEKPSKPSLSLINDVTYKSYIEHKTTVIKEQLDKFSYLLNPYEKIPVIHNQNHSMNYYKFYELLKYFKIENCKSIFSFYFDEEELYSVIGSSDAKHSSFNVENQDLFNLFNLFDNSYFDLIIANGSIDTSVDPNNQEQYNTHIIAWEIFNTLKLQQIGGNFILKIFDTLTSPMCQLLELLSNHYEKVYLVKPRTGDILGSEKFVICINYNSRSDELIDTIDKVLKKWKECEYSPSFCRDFGLTPSGNLIKGLDKYNKDLISSYIEFVKAAQKYQKLDQNLDQQQISEIEARNNKKAIQFGNAFGLTQINNKCKHYCKRFIYSINDSVGIKKCLFCDVLYI